MMETQTARESKMKERRHVNIVQPVPRSPYAYTCKDKFVLAGKLATCCTIWWLGQDHVWAVVFLNPFDISSLYGSAVGCGMKRELA